MQLKFSKILNRLDIVIFFFVILVTLRPITYSVGDFLVYLKGSRQILANQEIYEIDFAGFGTRFFNGPLWAYVISVLTIFPSSIALMIFRTLGLFASLKLLRMQFSNFTQQSFILVSLFLLWFPYRMNMNLAQGAAIAGMMLLIVSHKMSVGNLKTMEMFMCASLISIALNYKPALVLFFLVYLLITRHYKLLFLVSIFNGLFQAFLIKWNPNASYLKWFQLMLERNRRIVESDNSNLVGPWALLSRLFDLKPSFLNAFSILLFLTIVTLLVIRKKRDFNFNDSLVMLSIGVLIGPYSPAQDSFLLSLALIVYFKKENNIYYRYLLILISSFWSLSTEISYVKSVFLIIAISYLIFRVFNSFILSTIHLLFASILLIVSFANQYDHIIYDISGFGSLMASLYVLIKMLSLPSLNNMKSVV